MGIMKKVDEILVPKEKPFYDRTFILKLEMQIREYAIEANKLDNTKSVSYFYQLFRKRALKNYFEQKNKKQHFGNEPIVL